MSLWLSLINDHTLSFFLTQPLCNVNENLVDNGRMRKGSTRSSQWRCSIKSSCPQKFRNIQYSIFTPVLWSLFYKVAAVFRNIYKRLFVNVPGILFFIPTMSWEKNLEISIWSLVLKFDSVMLQNNYAS